jgi:hypothetical protein
LEFICFLSKWSHLVLVLNHDMTLNEDANMLTCNLSKTIHHKWHLMYGEKGIDSFETIVDNLTRALV